MIHTVSYEEEVIDNTPKVVASYEEDLANLMGSNIDMVNQKPFNTFERMIGNIETDNYMEVIKKNKKISSITHWDSKSKKVKYLEQHFSYDGIKVSKILTKIFDENGNIVETKTDNLSMEG